MNGFRSIQTTFLLVACVFFTGCGGGSSDSESAKSVEPAAPALLVGVFLDSPVEGLTYLTTSGESGTTNSNGEFLFQAGDDVIFSLANIVFPSVPAATVITPFDLLDSKNIYNQQISNTVQLLQSLDEDNDPSNGIKLDSVLLQLLNNTNIDFESLQLTPFEFEQALIDDGVFFVNQMTTIDSAIAHFSETLKESEIIDSDSDGLMNAVDSDNDNDGVDDVIDAFPWDENESSDFDLDFIGDNSDLDDDNDGISDVDDPILRIISNIDSTITSITHLKFDGATNRIFITNKDNKTLSVLDVHTGEIVQNFTFEKMPWRMALTSSSLYLTLLDREFEYYSEESGSGEVVELDLTTNDLEVTNRFSVAVDPFDIVATDNGKIVVSSGSNQWTSIMAYNAVDGLMLGSSNIRHKSYLTLHPSQKWVFAADTDSSPSDFEKFDIESPGITALGDSPYHGDYPISGRVWASESYIFSRSGNVFLASDMTYVKTLFEGQTIEDIQFDEEQNIAFIISDGITYLLNLSSSEIFATISNPGDVNHVLVAYDNNYTITNLNNSLTLVKTLHPCSNCGSNTAPIADFTYTPTSGSTQDTYEFDASNSSDAEDDSALQYRWDTGNDNQWDNDFTENPLYSIKFITAGTKFVTLQVKDSGGLLHTKTLDIDVALGVDSGTDIVDSTAYELQFIAKDTATDVTRKKLYLSDKSNKRLYVVNLENGQTEKYFEFDFMPERMTISPDGATLYLALLTQEHSSYWWEEDQSGYIAVFDLASQSQINVYEIPTDPYDLVVNDQGKLIVSSGSGQWADIYAFNGSDGTYLGQSSIRQASRLSLHPSGNYVFAADTDSSPSDFEKFDISGAGITAISDSPYHGDYSISGNVWVTPDGQYVISRGGHVFLASDMTYVQSIGGIDSLINDITFDTEQNLIFVVTSSGQAHYLNLSSWIILGTLNVSDVDQVILNNGDVLVRQQSLTSNTLVSFDHPCSNCGSNTSPIADFTYTPTSGSTQDTYEFDASNSSDAEGDSTLQYRWDMDNDNEWDNDFTDNPIYSIKFFIAETKFVTLQVKDSGGLLHTKTLDIDVALGVDSGTDIVDSTAYELQFIATDTATDVTRKKLYLSDKSNKRLYVVNLENGQTEKYFEFDFMPERMTISPDGTTLYLALLAQEHSSYWWEEEQSGYIAVFDLASQSQINVYEIPTDPYDLVVNDQGKLIVSSGSGQWTDIYAFNASDGTYLGQSFIRQASRLSLHPSGNYVFAADTDSSPSDFERFDISGTGIIAISDSPYHGDYSISGNVWVTPDGQYVISRGGHVFLASDMTYVQSIGGIDSLINDITFDIENDIINVLLSSMVTRLNLNDFETIDYIEARSAIFIESVNDKLFGLSVEGATTELINYSFE